MCVTRRGKASAAAALVAFVLLLLSGCTGGDDSSLSDKLRKYTDPDDGCPQVVSAIAYADSKLKPLGQEVYQSYTDEVRSRLSAVDGTISLEVEDFPDDDILDHAKATGAEAAEAAASTTKPAERTRSLREYRRDAAELVLLCAPYADPSPSPSPSS
jgi:hypothetical protein